MDYHNAPTTDSLNAITESDIDFELLKKINLLDNIKKSITTIKHKLKDIHVVHNDNVAKS